MTADDVVVLPPASRATAVNVCVPADAVVVSHATEYDGPTVSSRPSGAPSSRNCTPTTPTLSLAFAVTVRVPETVAPPAGAVIETDGATPSSVVNVRSVERARFNAASRDRTR